MRTSLKRLALAGVLCAGLLTIHAADKKQLAGPKGGRLLEKAALKPVAAGEQAVTVVADAKGRKKTITFEKKGDVLVSKAKLPEGDGYNLVVQFKQTTEAKPQNFRFQLETHACGECKRAEYACICGH